MRYPMSRRTWDRLRASRRWPSRRAPADPSTSPSRRRAQPPLAGTGLLHKAIGSWVQPAIASQASAVHGSRSSQSSGPPGSQAPAPSQASPVVQVFPSSTCAFWTCLSQRSETRPSAHSRR